MTDTDAFFASLHAWIWENPLAALGALIGCVIILRLAVLIAEERPDPAPAPPGRPGKSWWQQILPSTVEQLAEQQDEIAARAHFMRTKREEVLAHTDLLKAQGELDAELQAAKNMAPGMTDDQPASREPSLSLPQILGVLELADLKLDDKRDLETLFRRCLDDARSAK